MAKVLRLTARYPSDRVFPGAVYDMTRKLGRVEAVAVDPVYAAAHWDTHTAAWVVLARDVGTDFGRVYSRYCGCGMCVDRSGQGAAALVCVTEVSTGSPHWKVSHVVLDVTLPAIAAEGKTEYKWPGGLRAIAQAVAEHLPATFETNDDDSVM